MKLLENGLLKRAVYRGSANQDERPPDTEIDLLVIHSISLPPGEFGGSWIDSLFMNCLDAGAHPFFQEIKELRVSIHLLIRRDGSLVQYVPFHNRAWHAGESSFCGQQRCNDFSIGIELEGCDDKPFTEEQYQSLAEATTQIMNSYPSITQERITGHADISPGRKTDPGPLFDWDYYFSLLHS
ncbi:MAG: 1,6-anhydro-N-acetylmuramyl-L-alanine amidase AmpD [Candidatus Thiodiazotropha sp. L084R]